HATLYPAAQTHGIFSGPRSPPCAADIDGDGVLDMVVDDYDSGGHAAASYALVKPDDPLSATWPFRPWTSVALTGFADGAPMPLGRLGGGCAFADFGSINFAFVDGSGAKVTTLTADSTFFAALRDVTGDGKPDLLVQDSTGIVHVFPGDGN